MSSDRMVSERRERVRFDLEEPRETVFDVEQEGDAGMGDGLYDDLDLRDDPVVEDAIDPDAGGTGPSEAAGHDGAIESTPGAAPPAVASSPVAARVRTATFREKLRGYHPDDVDSFLEQLALSVEDLENRLADATARLRDAEDRATVATAGEQTVRRTLMLAQRTAELAIAEAKERAAQLIAEADDEASARVGAVEQECADIRAREAGRLEAEVARLEDARTAAAAQLELLEARRAEEHERLRAILDELRYVVDARLRPNDET